MKYPRMICSGAQTGADQGGLHTDSQAALRDASARRLLHRIATHDSTDDEEFFDCAACEVLDRQIARALAACGEEA